MVGVGTSKGCKTCRRRKVKCDERKPTCNRCETAGLTCEGYPSRLKWVDEVPRLSQGGRSGSEASPQPESSSTAAKSSPASATHPPRGLSLSPFQDVVFSTYLSEKFLDNGEGYTYKSWITNALKEDPADPAHLAMQSFAALFFARQNRNDTKVIAHASSLYGQALRRLNQSLTDPQTCYTHSNVSAAFALNLYEVYAFTKAVGWIQHAGGIGSLMQALGPTYFAEYPAHGTFLLSRIMIIMRSYVLREHCFLEELEWRTVPWETYSETKTEEHVVLDFIARIPGFHADCIKVDNLVERMGDDPKVAAELEKLKVDIVQFGKEVINWRMAWEIKYPSCTWEKPAFSGSFAVDADGTPVFGNMLYFLSPERATEVVLYNCVMISLIHFSRRYPPGSLINALLQDWPEERRPRRTNNLLLPHETMHSLHCAAEICKTVEYELMEGQVNAGYFHMLMPLRISMTTFGLYKGYERQFTWISNYFRNAAEATGMQVFRRLISLTPLSREPDSPDKIDPQLVKYVPNDVRSSSGDHMSIIQSYTQFINVIS